MFSRNKFTQSYFEKLTPSSIDNSVIKETVRDILKKAEEELGKDIKEFTVLDVGSGWGEYSMELGRYVKEVIGLEPYDKVYLVSIRNNKRSNVKFLNLPVEIFKSGKKFDLVISLTTIEHMPQALKSFRNIYNLMKKDSLLYLTAPNKLWPIEQHYRLPFLSYLPLRLADLYLTISRRGKTFKDSSYALSYFQIKNLFNKFNWKYDFVLPGPRAIYLGCGKDTRFEKAVKKIGINLIKMFPFMWIFSKGFIIVAKKGQK